MKNLTVRHLEEVLRKLGKGWTQGTWARNKKGTPVASDSPQACRWCLSGALFSIKGTSKARTFLKQAISGSHDNPLNPVGIVSFNDRHGRKKSEVLAVIRKAIELAKQEAV